MKLIKGGEFAPLFHTFFGEVDGLSHMLSVRYVTRASDQDVERAQPDHEDYNAA